MSEDDEDRFNKAQIKSLVQVIHMVRNNGGKICGNIQEIAKYLNQI